MRNFNGYLGMQITVIDKKDAKHGTMVLASFLQTFIARLKYGRCVIYDGDGYFVPFAALVFSVRETGEKYAFLSSLIADDYTLFKLDGNVAFVSSVLDQNAVARVLDMKKSTKQGIDELRKRMSLNSKLQKLKRRYTLDEDEPFLAYLKEPSFYADGKKLTFFLIDPLLEKVDFRHVQAAKERFAQLSMKTVNK